MAGGTHPPSSVQGGAEVESQLNIRHLAPHCGSEILHVDPRTLTDAQVARIRAEAADRCVIIIRGANLDPEELVAFAGRFGTVLHVGSDPVLEIHNSYELARDNPGFAWMGRIQTTNHWHTDAAHERTPAAFTMLSAREVPGICGDTMWINQYLAYETLSGAMRAMLHPLRAEHIMHPYFTSRRNEDNPLGSVHPLVRINAHTGRRSLYINNPRFMTTIERMSEYESAPLLDFLYRHSQQYEHSYRHRWQPGDFVCWDNRSTLHYALLDYDQSARRILSRVVTIGEEPIGVDC
jgi:taurine dioxygenase